MSIIDRMPIDHKMPLVSANSVANIKESFPLPKRTILQLTASILNTAPLEMEYSHESFSDDFFDKVYVFCSMETFVTWYLIFVIIPMAFFYHSSYHSLIASIFSHTGLYNNAI